MALFKSYHGSNGACPYDLDHDPQSGNLNGGGVTSAREYVWGTFVHGEPSVANANTVFFATDVEPLREVLRANLASCLQLLYLPLVRR